MRDVGIVSIELLKARVPVELSVGFDADDVVLALDNNDESILLFITQMLEAADSVDLRERLAARLLAWDEEHA